MQLCVLPTAEYAAFQLAYIANRNIVYAAPANQRALIDLRYVLNALNIFEFLFRHHEVGGFGWQLRCPPSVGSHFTNTIYLMTIRITDILMSVSFRHQISSVGGGNGMLPVGYTFVWLSQANRYNILGNMIKKPINLYEAILTLRQGYYGQRHVQLVNPLRAIQQIRGLPLEGEAPDIPIPDRAVLTLPDGNPHPFVNVCCYTIMIHVSFKVI